jgi:hypothetical protein
MTYRRRVFVALLKRFELCMFSLTIELAFSYSHHECLEKLPLFEVVCYLYGSVYYCSDVQNSQELLEVCC